MLQSSMRSSMDKKKKMHSKNDTVRHEQKRIQSLMDELEHSRIAVEQIDHWRKDERAQNSDIITVRNELKHCIISLKTEQRRQNVLNELVSLLRDEMAKIKIKQVQISQKQTIKLNNTIQQLEHDIDQISSKKNQQIARISVLKQNINQSRSQRVVYSNLFKKIQKQLKQDQETYKNLLLKAMKVQTHSDQQQGKKIKNYDQQQAKLTQKSKDTDQEFSIIQGSSPLSKQKRQQIPCRGLSSLRMGTSDNDEQSLIQTITRNHTTEKIRSKLTKKNSQNNKQSNKQSNKQNSIINKSLVMNRTARANQMRQNCQKSLWEMEELIKINDRIKLLTACQSTQDIILLNENIGPNNLQLQVQIDQICQNISHFQQQIKKISHLTAVFLQTQMNQSQEDLSNQFQNQSRIRRKRSFNLEKCGYGKQNQGKESQRRSRIKNVRRGQLANRFLQTEKSQEETVQQFIQLYNLLNVPEANSQNLGQQQNLMDINPLKMSNSELEEKCKLIDSTVSEICQWISSNDYASQQNVHHHNAVIKSQLLNQGNDSELVNDKFNSADETRLKSEEGSSSRQTNSFLNIVLSRMEKFGSCEKLLDRDGFFGQYRKEITKKAKPKLKKG